MPDNNPDSVMIYEVKGKTLSDPPQKNYRSLTSSDGTKFFWNIKKFRSLNRGDIVFVVNRGSQEVLWCELEATGITTTYNADSNSTSFTDQSAEYHADGEWPSFVRLNVIERAKCGAQWDWKTLGSSETTYMLGDKVSAGSATNNIVRAQQLAKAFPSNSDVTDLLQRCESALQKLAGNTVTKPADDSTDAFVTVLEKYAREKIIFRSTERGATYSISFLDGGRFQVDRLDADQPVSISVSAYLNKKTLILGHGNRLPFATLDSTSALRNTYLQSQAFALSADGKDVLVIANLKEAGDLFCEVLKSLRVGETATEPILYKPAMLACVIEAIETGDLKSNEITFDFIAPRFIAKMAALGESVSVTQAA